MLEEVWSTVEIGSFRDIWQEKLSHLTCSHFDVAQISNLLSRVLIAEIVMILPTRIIAIGQRFIYILLLGLVDWGLMGKTLIAATVWLVKIELLSYCKVGHTSIGWDGLAQIPQFLTACTCCMTSCWDWLIASYLTREAISFNLLPTLCCSLMPPVTISLLSNC